MTVRDASRRISAQVGALHDDKPWLGPSIFVASALYFFAQITVAWVFRPSYSLIDNSISDLGNTTCGWYDHQQVCSSRHAVMNVAFFLLGVVMASGSMLLYHEFAEKRPRERRAALCGFLFMALGGIGAMLVGIFPENTNTAMHIIGAGLAIGGGNVGIFILGAVLTLPESMRRYMLLFSTISVTALILFACHKDFGIGAGTMERLAAYPETIWLVSFGLYIWRFHPKNDPAPAA